jgi:hypothetical protein
MRHAAIEINDSIFIVTYETKIHEIEYIQGDIKLDEDEINLLKEQFDYEKAIQILNK